MSGSVLWGVLAITGFSLLGFGGLAWGGLRQRLPWRLRVGIEIAAIAFYAAILSGNVHQVFFRPNGLVAEGHLSDAAARLAWVALSVLFALAALRWAVQSYRGNSRSTRVGASS